MKTVAITIAAIALTAVAGAAAAQGRVSDAAYFQAARCSGLATGAAVSAEGFAAFVKTAEQGRTPAVRERADQIFVEAKRKGARNKAVAQAELDNGCAAFRAPATTPAG